MGFSFRKRTKGSGAWINFSASKKNGLGASVSLRPTKGVTINLKPGRTARTTISIAGTGLRWTGGGKSTHARPSKEVKYKPMSAAAIRREREAAIDRDIEREEAEYEALCDRMERIAEIEHRLRVIDQELNEATIYKRKMLREFGELYSDENPPEIMSRILQLQIAIAGQVEIENRLINERKLLVQTINALKRENGDNVIEPTLAEQFIATRDLVRDCDILITMCNATNWNKEDVKPFRTRRNSYLSEMRDLVRIGVLPDAEIDLPPPKLKLEHYNPIPVLMSFIGMLVGITFLCIH